MAHPTGLCRFDTGCVAVRAAHLTGLSGLVLGFVVRTAHPTIHENPRDDTNIRRVRRAHRNIAADMFIAPLPGQ